ncbi:hypothetical protein [Streptomyces abikoensis]|uniref:hypothetical protein n=1 Tax=Streptomyces abikoensis TaxID=97398 RepID=UPI00340FC2E6
MSATLTVATPAARVFAAVPRSIREYIQFPPFGSRHLTDSLKHLAGLVRSGG